MASHFQPVSKVPQYRLIWRSWGADKTGKNHLGLDAPGPVYVLSFDRGLEGVVEKFIKGFTDDQGRTHPARDVRAANYFLRSRQRFTQDDAQRLAAQIEEDFYEALEQARTVQLDTDTHIWEIFRYAEFGAASEAPREYAPVNARYETMLNAAKDCGVNLQLIQKVKEKWENFSKTRRDGTVVEAGRPTGQMEPTGFKGANYVVQANIEHRFEPGRGFVQQVVNCRQNMSLAGIEFEHLTFPELGQLVFPETNEGDWV